MIKQLQLLLLSFLIQNFIFAQVVISPNPSYTNPANKPFFDEFLDTDVFSAADPQPEPPSEGEICFDKKIKIKVISTRGPVETCMYVNTKIGLIGYSELRQDGSGICDILTGTPDFKLNILGLKGDMFFYQNIQRKGRLEHWLHRTPRARTVAEHSGFTPGILYNKGKAREYFGGKVKAWLYQSNTDNTKYYIFGKNLPPKLEPQPVKYLGLFGVGYQYTAEGLFVIMEMENDAYSATILSMENVPNCFNASLFRTLTSVATDIAEQRVELSQERFDRQREENPTDCDVLKQKSITQEKRNIAKNKAEHERVKQMPNATNYQKEQASLNTMMNAEDVIEQEILKTEYRICQFQTRLQHSSSGNQGYLQEKLKCLDKYIKVQQQKRDEIKQVKIQFPNQAGRQQQEQIKILLSMQDPCR